MIHEKYPNYFINQKLSEKKISCNHADHICISNNTKIDLIEKFKN